MSSRESKANLHSRETEVAVEYEHSSHFADVLKLLRTTVLLTTDQAGKLVAIGTHADRPTFSFHSFDQVMGVAIGKDRIAVGSRSQIHFSRAAHEILDAQLKRRRT